MSDENIKSYDVIGAYSRRLCNERRTPTFPSVFKGFIQVEDERLVGKLQDRGDNSTLNGIFKETQMGFKKQYEEYCVDYIFEQHGPIFLGKWLIPEFDDAANGYAYLRLIPTELKKSIDLFEIDPLPDKFDWEGIPDFSRKLKEMEQWEKILKICKGNPSEESMKELDELAKGLIYKI